MPELKKQSQVPSQEDFARAKSKSRQFDEIAGRVREAVLDEFRERAPISSVWLFPGQDGDLNGYVFYFATSDVADSLESGLSDEIEKALVRKSKELIGSGCSVIFDSHESVVRKCNGNYFQYLR
ncbi:hypothetical protein [Silanimonas sp.]|uniref:hypothetical protein n=1 Tax=Silanimonas sp. TaxID=1929290 RepID=UPI0022CA1802|nr:hypothetical protein [Silanimonas sp.]MCZ8064229.1 hypothetical protein [Silanimonas sp.]